MVPFAVPSLRHSSSAPFSSPWINKIPLTSVMEMGVKGSEGVLESDLGERTAKPESAKSAVEAKLTGSIVAASGAPIPAEMKGTESVVEVRALERNDGASLTINPGQGGMPKV